MRKRISRALLTAAAAGATITTLGFAAASPAGASAAHRYFTPTGGTPIATNANCHLSSPPVPADNCGMAGYQASGRDFRFAQALVTVPNHVANKFTDPVLYVALDGSGTATYQFTRVGVAPCPSGGTAAIVPGHVIFCPASTSNWVAFSAIAGAQGSTVNVFPISSVCEGDGVSVSAYLVPTGNGVHTVISIPCTGATFNNNYTVSGPVYTRAQALADWTTTVENGGAQPLPAVPGAKVRDAQFFQGRFTTVSGAQGTFNGPWSLNALEATSNGHLPPMGTLIGQPSFLWNDGNSFNGLGDDAFGVWRFPF
ncbi:MAG TPA: hypothetical protein VGS19_26160 [Streptosporangiaceae bacterium]|nr:hypothetical protein [Streptosporangiaceae bacterium]